MAAVTTRMPVNLQNVPNVAGTEKAEGHGVSGEGAEGGIGAVPEGAILGGSCSHEISARRGQHFHILGARVSLGPGSCIHAGGKASWNFELCKSFVRRCGHVVARGICHHHLAIIIWPSSVGHHQLAIIISRQISHPTVGRAMCVEKRVDGDAQMNDFVLSLQGR